MGEDDEFCFRASRAAFTPVRREQLSERKAEIVALLAKQDGKHSSPSLAQQRLWLLQQLEPGDTSYNMSQAIRMTGALDVGTLRKALGAISARQEALRTTFAMVDGSSAQVIAPAFDASLPVEDLSDLPKAKREEAVHVWRAALGAHTTRLIRLEHHLSAEERARAARFRFDRDRRHFIAARGLLREIVSHYVNVAPHRLSFGYGAHGKPFLVQEGSNLSINVSHSSDTALFAVARGREVGVDIERIRADFAVERLAETVFSAPEKHVIGGLHGEDRRAAFFRLWTRKEAYIKADGRGVSLPLDHIDVSSVDDRVASWHEGSWHTCKRWMLRTFGAGRDYAAAVAAEGQDWHLVCRQWPG